MGPKTLPCGTPLLIDAGLDSKFPILSFCNLLDKKAAIHLCKNPEMPEEFHFKSSLFRPTLHICFIPSGIKANIRLGHKS